MTKRIILIALLVSGIMLSSIPGAKSKMKPYYAGDAINYNGTVVVASVNMDAFELFKLDENTHLLARMAKVKSFRQVYSGYDGFNSVVLSIEDGRLFAYLTDGGFLYRYDISDLSHPALQKQLKDNSWDWFGAVTKAGGHLMTIGSNGVKVWNSDLQVIDAFKIGTKRFDCVSISQDGKFIFVAEDKALKVFDTNTRSFTSSIALKTADNHSRKAYSAGDNGIVYAIDDDNVKELHYNGDIAKNFNHISRMGYEVSVIDDESVYFSDGIGVVELAKDTFKPMRWAYTTTMAGGNGWAMGLRVVPSNQGKVVIVFNNTSILVLNNKLRLVTYSGTTETENKPFEDLGMKLDQYSGRASTTVMVVGSGYAPNETLAITFGDDKYSNTADANGRFSQVVTAPSVVFTNPRDSFIAKDIRVTGMTSNRTWSTGFRIER